MGSKELMQMLALERCRLNLSHICALNHLSENEAGEEKMLSSVTCLVENLHKDFALMEGLLLEDR